MNDFVVTGTPGVGKSTFNFYLLYLLRLEGKTVICKFNDIGRRNCPEDGPIRQSRKHERSQQLVSILPKSQPDQKFKGAPIVTVPPETNGTNELTKQRNSKNLGSQ